MKCYEGIREGEVKRRERERTVGDLAQVRVAQEGLPEERTFTQDQKDGRRQAGRQSGNLPPYPCPSREPTLQPLHPTPKQEVPLISSLPQAGTLG